MKFGIAALLLMTAPAYGLDLRDTMLGWKQATIEDRAVLLKHMLDDRSETIVVNRSEVIACTNEVANTHLLLAKRFGEMIELCLDKKD